MICETPGAPAESAAPEEAAPAEAPAEETPPPPQEVPSAVRGVAIPNFQEIPPQHTSGKSRMVRAGQSDVEIAPPPPPAEEPAQQPEAAPAQGEPPASEGDAVETVVQLQPAGGEEQPDAS